MARFILSAFADEASADIHEQIAACKQNGIGFIELRNVNGKNISDFTVDEAKELKELLDSERMGVSGTACSARILVYGRSSSVLSPCTCSAMRM